MSYTCGAATGDDIATVITQLGATATSCFVAGWWKPTTLTATRGLWSAGNIFGAEIDTTTSELRLRTDNTTDGQWTTTGVGLTVNQWKFLAFANSCNNTGPAAAWVVWSGTGETAPQQVTVTQATAPNGNFTGSTAVVLGNKGTGTLAFQGEIGPAVFARHASSIQGFVPTTTAGTIAQEGIDVIYERLVLPIWSGIWCPPWLRQPRLDNNLQQAAFLTSLDYAGPLKIEVKTNETPLFGDITLNGVTLSQERCPRPMPLQAPVQPQYVRR